MISDPVVHACSAFLAHLFAPAARSLCLGCLAALAVGALRVKSVSGRLAVWKMVLYAALAMPLLGLILPPLSLELPSAVARLIPQRATVANALRQSGDTPATGALAPEAFPIAPLSLHPEIPLPKSDADVHPVSTMRTSRSDILPADSSILPNAAPVVREYDASPEPAAKSTEASFPWIVFFAAIYISITLVFLGRLLLGIIFSRGLVRGARPIAESEVAGLLIIDEREDHPAVPLHLAESELISVPITLGILRPIILLPVEWREWGPAALRAVLTHERSHVSRRDALTQRLSLLHRAIFWFSPLSWWLHGRLADAAEEASDEAALLSGADRAQYAETLLGFFVALQQAPRRVHWQGVSMAKAGQAEKRVDRILAWEGDGSMHLNKSLSISLLLLGIAVVFFAAAARPSIAHAQDGVNIPIPVPIPVPAPLKPAATDNPGPGAPPPPMVVAAQQAPAVAQPAPEPVPPSAPAPSAVPLPEAGPNSFAIPPAALHLKDFISEDQIRKFYRDAYGATSRAELSTNEVQVAVELHLKQLQREGVFRAGAYPMSRGAFDGGFRGRYVIVSGDSPILMSGDSEDVEHATSLRHKINGDYIWFQHDEKNYVIRDKATVERAKEIFKPEEDLGQKQDALGKQQQALGDQQRELSKKMEAVRVQIPDMSADMQKLEAQMKQLSSGGTQQQLGNLQRQIAELQHKIGESQYQAGDQQRQIGEQMRDLGQEQGELGRQQGQLGRQQAEASRQANEQMRQLLDDAVTRGTAQPE